MRFDEQPDYDNVEDRRHQMGPTRRAGGGGALIALIFRLFGWKGALVAVGGYIVATQVFGIDPTQLISGGGRSQPSRHMSGTTSNNGAAQSDQAKRFVTLVLNSNQRMWRKLMPGYRDARLVLFTNRVDSACGLASSATGPFYCPRDNKVYKTSVSTTRQCTVSLGPHAAQGTSRRPTSLPTRSATTFKS